MYIIANVPEALAIYIYNKISTTVYIFYMLLFSLRTLLHEQFLMTTFLLKLYF